MSSVRRSVLRGAWKQAAAVLCLLALQPFDAAQSMAAAAEGESKLPQFDPATFEPQLIWLFITFLGLYLVMSRSALPKVGSILEERADRKADDLDEANRARKESESIEAAYQEILAEARAGAIKTLREARKNLNAELDTRKQKMGSQLAKRVTKAEENVAKAKNKAMKDLEAIAAETCQAIVRKLSGREVTKKNALSTVRAKIKSLR